MARNSSVSEQGLQSLKGPQEQVLRLKIIFLSCSVGKCQELPPGFALPWVALGVSTREGSVCWPREQHSREPLVATEEHGSVGDQLLGPNQPYQLGSLRLGHLKRI